jgi:hypothetical protein
MLVRLLKQFEPKKNFTHLNYQERKKSIMHNTYKNRDYLYTYSIEVISIFYLII